MPVPVHPVNTGAGALILKPAQLLYVCQIGRNEAAATGKSLGFVQQLPLLDREHGEFALPAALAPGVLEKQPVAAIRPFRPDFDGLRPAQAERRLQAQGEMCVGIAHLGQVAGGQLPRLADVGDVPPLADAVMFVVPGDDAGLADLFSPPSNLRHAVLHGGDGQPLRLPLLDQPFDVLGSQTAGAHMTIAHLLKLGRDPVQDVLTVTARVEAAVRIAATQLLQRVIEISHSLLPLLLEVVGSLLAPARCQCAARYGWCGSIGQCFCPSRTRERAEATRDTGHHARFAPVPQFLANRGAGLGVDAAFLLEAAHRYEPLTQARRASYRRAVEVRPRKRAESLDGRAAALNWMRQ